ncbi:response regulator [Aetokthonos hydrillicola Thurmond2011]|jgi:CheY-like chemotaxis protein|uniref:Response regulator n=1 Tax=Aetokthonos hydrillicola Thurmond2011 TaxID=2712845 RepID=A0AAP5I422_9CYAN|nr:response regulator [Aetokthonos hydrillicola]MBO3463525.1 response regulator [Aetokthonos hydrillicola CCALA 1050]MBW4584946.1 response regulator [Aetokthonos hydrillicola CCALA 1050]MDR9894295.1 response regulator [Aetokthonos hydrillicola Thurmond2011]
MKTEIFSIDKKDTLHKGKRILLIEDNDINRMLLGDYLIYCGYEVQSLPEASSFFSIVDKFKPQLVLLDLKLPDIDGYSLLEQIQLKPDFSNIPIIVVSAFAFKADQERAIQLGACRYFVKPIDLSKLLTAIEEELAHQRI